MKVIFTNQLLGRRTGGGSFALTVGSLLVAVFSLMGLIAPTLSLGQEQPKDPRGWADLSEKEQKQLKDALRTVWSDPTVLSARESVNRSAQEYQSAVREMIKKQNPETAVLLDRVQKSQPPGMMQMFLGDFHGAKRPIHGLGLSSPAVMERMDEAQRARFKEAEAKAKMKPEVIAAMEELKALSQQDEEIRRKKMEAFRKLRQVHLEAIEEIDPELKEFLPPPGSGKPKGPKKVSAADGEVQSPPN